MNPPIINPISEIYYIFKFLMAHIRNYSTKYELFDMKTTMLERMEINLKVSSKNRYESN